MNAAINQRMITNVNEGGMNYSAEICRAVLDGQSLAEAIYDRVGVTEKVGDALVGKLCGEGALINTRGRLSIGNRNRAEIIAEGAAPKGAPPVTTALLATPVKRRPPPVPASITIRKDVPCPPARMGKSSLPNPWPFAGMVVGDSFSVDVPEGYEAREVAKPLHSDASRFSKQNAGYHFAVRIAVDGKSVGVWRDEAKVKADSSPGPVIPAAAPSIPPPPLRKAARLANGKARTR